MKVTIHNVEHGLCVSLIKEARTHYHSDGSILLWDCGHTEHNRPSDFLCRYGKIIDHLFVTNYDEDHISDLPNIVGNFHVGCLHRNESISADQLRKLKYESGVISPAMESMLDMIEPSLLDSKSSRYLGSRVARGLDSEKNRWLSIGIKRGSDSKESQWLGMGLNRVSNSETILYLKAKNNSYPNIRWNLYRNEYGFLFTDTNNISLVTFLHFNGICLLIPGDLETAGWRDLLKQNKFKEDLRRVDFFVASHHGRENGYCREVFDYCRPYAFIFSDSQIKYTTQEMAAKYKQHASGYPLNGDTRYVFSTRKDGDIILHA